MGCSASRPDNPHANLASRNNLNLSRLRRDSRRSSQDRLSLIHSSIHRDQISNTTRPYRQRRSTTSASSSFSTYGNTITISRSNNNSNRGGRGIRNSRDEIYSSQSFRSGYERATTPQEQNLDQLRTDLVALEHLFQTLLGQHQVSPSSFPSTTLCTTTPPASSDIIENLPTMAVSDLDLQDECNKECSICFMEFKVNDKVSRLQCGHFFHGECINEWLRKRCTCPVCRWELETEDTNFEIERLERMKSRKIRVKDHELDRLCIEGLQDIAGTKGITNRKKLIETIRSLEHVDIITR